MKKLVQINKEEGTKTTTTFELQIFISPHDLCYGFTCDQEGNVDEAELNPAALANWQKVKAGLADGSFSSEVLPWSHVDYLCSCGSGLERYDLCDARGIFCAYVCRKCEAEVKGKYRAEIFEDGSYDADEPIEEEDY